MQRQVDQKKERHNSQVNSTGNTSGVEASKSVATPAEGAVPFIIDMLTIYFSNDGDMALTADMVKTVINDKKELISQGQKIHVYLNGVVCKPFLDQFSESEKSLYNRLKPQDRKKLCKSKKIYAYDTLFETNRKIVTKHFFAYRLDQAKDRILAKIRNSLEGFGYNIEFSIGTIMDFGTDYMTQLTSLVESRYQQSEDETYLEPRAIVFPNAHAIYKSTRDGIWLNTFPLCEFNPMNKRLAGFQFYLNFEVGSRYDEFIKNFNIEDRLTVNVYIVHSPAINQTAKRNLVDKVGKKQAIVSYQHKSILQKLSTGDMDDQEFKGKFIAPVFNQKPIIGFYGDRNNFSVSKAILDDYIIATLGKMDATLVVLGGDAHKDYLGDGLEDLGVCKYKKIANLSCYLYRANNVPALLKHCTMSFVSGGNTSIESMYACPNGTIACPPKHHQDARFSCYVKDLDQLRLERGSLKDNLQLLNAITNAILGQKVAFKKEMHKIISDTLEGYPKPGAISKPIAASASGLNKQTALSNTAPVSSGKGASSSKGAVSDKVFSPGKSSLVDQWPPLSNNRRPLGAVSINTAKKPVC